VCVATLAAGMVPFPGAGVYECECVCGLSAYALRCVGGPIVLLCAMARDSILNSIRFDSIRSFDYAVSEDRLFALCQASRFYEVLWISYYYQYMPRDSLKYTCFRARAWVAARPVSGLGVKGLVLGSGFRV